MTGNAMMMRLFDARLAIVEADVKAIAEELGVELPEDSASVLPADRNALKFPPEAPSEIEATKGATDLAEEEGIDLAEIEGSGENGRIIKADVAKAIS